MFIALHAAASPQSSQAFAQSPNRIFGAQVTEDVIGGRCSAAKDSPRAGDYFQILFNGIGQIYLVGDPIAGAFMLLGTMAYSRLIAACLCAGVIIGARFSDGIVSLIMLLMHLKLFCASPLPPLLDYIPLLDAPVAAARLAVVLRTLPAFRLPYWGISRCFLV